MLKFLPFLSVTYSLVLAVLSLVKSPTPNGIPTNSDKLFHLLAYCLFTLVWFLTLHNSFKKERKKSITIAVIAAIVLGIIIEILQHTVTTYREADLLDILANTVGACLAVLIINFVTKRKVKN